MNKEILGRKLFRPSFADVVELADTHGSGPCGATCAGSNPVIRIEIQFKLHSYNVLVTEQRGNY